MLRILYFLILSILSTNLLAYEYHDLSGNFSSQSKSLSKKLRLRGFDKFYRTNDQLFLVDQVFEKGDQRVFVKLGLRTKLENQKKFISFRKGHIYNFSQSGMPVSIYFENMSQIQRLKVVKRVRSFLSLKKFSLMNIIMPNAYAQDCTATMDPILSVEHLEEPVQKFNKDYLMQQASGCVQKALAGAWQRTGGLVEDVGRGIWSFIKSPIKSSKEFWNKAVDTYEVTKKFIANIDTEMSKLGQALGSLSVESQVQLACSLVGSIGGGVLMGMITGGPAGIANGVLTLQQSTARLVKMTNVLKLFDKLKAQGKIGKEKMSQLLDKIILTQNKAGLEKVNDLANANFSKLTMEYASCAL
jgi:hypothetical protein